MTKPCSTCNREKDLSEFGLRSGKPLKSCKECRAKDNARCAQNREEISAYGRKWRAAHIEQEKARQTRRKETERDKARVRNEVKRLERLANPEPARAKARARRATRAERERETRKTWAIANRQKTLEAYTLSFARRRARKLNLPHTFSHKEKTFMFQYFGYACAACGNQEGFTHILSLDHWIPLSNLACPGTVAWNMIPLCHGLGGCNNSKCNIDPDIWLKEKFGKRKASIILKRIEAYFALVRPLA